MKTNNTKNLLIIVVVTFLGLAGIFAYGIYDIQSKNQETSELLNQIEVRSEGALLHQSIRSMQTSAQEELDLLDEIALAPNEIVDFIEEIEGLGRGLGLNVSIESVSEIKATESEPEKIRIIFETSGAWEDIFSLLRIVEHIPKKVVLEEVKLSKEELSWASDISLIVYVSE